MKFESFENTFKDSTSNFTKVKNEDYKPNGEFPIIDQGQTFIGGYTDNEKLITKPNFPVLIFGDHTKIFKYVDFPFTIGADGVKVLTLKNPEYNPLYFYYYFKSIKIVDKGYSRHFKYLKEKKLPVPENISDQIQIANILSKAETLIEQRKQSIALLDELLKSSFLEMFGSPMINEKDWEKVSLSKLGSIERGVSKNRPRNSPELLGGKYPLIQTGVVTNSGLFITSYKHTYSELGLKQSKLWKKGTMLITIAANIAQTSILTFDACFPDSIAGFITNEKEANTIYVHFLFSFLQKIIEKNAPQMAQKNINLAFLRSLKVPKPPIELQTQFAQLVEKTEALKEQYKNSLQELENLYGSLSQQAFKGELNFKGKELQTKN